jgi:hypothetical protein
MFTSEDYGNVTEAINKISSLDNRRDRLFHGVNTMSNGPGPGSAGNVIAAVCSFFIPGLGQLVQGRVLMALVMFVLAGILWWFLLGWIIHLWSVIDAALYRG